MRGPECKRVISVLEHYGFLPDYVFAREDINIKVNCPFHGESEASCSISLGEGIFYCFGCGKSGDLIDLIAKVEGINRLQAMIRVHRINNDPDFLCGKNPGKYFEDTFYVDKKLLLERAETFFESLPLIFWGNIKNNYMYNRGFVSQILDRFKVKINQSSSHPIIIPLYEEGIFKGYVLRRYDNEEPKYLYNRGFDKKNVIIGELFYTPLLVVEGVLDLMKAVQNGHRNTCALLGWSPSKYQLKKISQSTNCIISGLDNDSSGIKGHNILKNNFGEKVIRFPYKKNENDICDLDKEEFIKRMHNIV